MEYWDQFAIARSRKKVWEERWRNLVSCPRSQNYKSNTELKTILLTIQSTYENDGNDQWRCWVMLNSLVFVNEYSTTNDYFSAHSSLPYSSNQFADHKSDQTTQRQQEDQVTHAEKDYVRSETAEADHRCPCCPPIFKAKLILLKASQVSVTSLVTLPKTISHAFVYTSQTTTSLNANHPPNHQPKSLITNISHPLIHRILAPSNLDQRNNTNKNDDTSDTNQNHPSLYLWCFLVVLIHCFGCVGSRGG